MLVGAILGFLWFAYRVGPIPSLGQLMNDPYCALPANQRATFAGHACALLQTQPFEGFVIRLKVGVAAGFVLTSPVWLYQIWAFITPGLYRRSASSRWPSSRAQSCCSAAVPSWRTWWFPRR